MPDHMLDITEARQQGFPLDPLKFRECTDRVQLNHHTRYFESRFYFVGLTEIISSDGIEMTWLSLRRNDRKAMQDWRHLQAIKNELCGEEREAVQIYPAESRLIDESNQIHLWVYPQGARLPFGYAHRSVMTATELDHQYEAITNNMPDTKLGKPEQRPFSPKVEGASRSYEEMIDDLVGNDLHTRTVHRVKEAE